MCEPVTTSIFLAGTGVQLVGAGMAARDAQQQGLEAQKAARENARLARREAGQVRQAGARAAAEAKMKGTRIIAEQKAEWGASGIDGGVGTPLELMAESRMNAELDAMTLSNNALREAWGLQKQATQAETEGRRAALAGRRQAAATLLGAGAGAATGLTGKFGPQIVDYFAKKEG